MNAIDDIRIRSGADTVTTEEAEAVVTWLREWVADCEGSQVVADMDTPALLRYCDAAIEGGIAFVLADVRRCADRMMLPKLAQLRREHAELMATAPKGSDIYGAKEARLAQIRREIAKLESEAPEPTLQPTGYGIDPADGSSTEDRAKAARKAAQDRRIEEAERIEELESALQGTPYFVEKTFNGGEDGMLWQVKRELESGAYVTLTEGGWHDKEGAMMEALCMAAPDYPRAASTFEHYADDADEDDVMPCGCSSGSCYCDDEQPREPAKPKPIGSEALAHLEPGTRVMVDGSREGGQIIGYIGRVFEVRRSGCVLIDDEHKKDGAGTPIRHYCTTGTVTIMRKQEESNRIRAARLADAMNAPEVTRDGTPVSAQVRLTAATLLAKCEEGWQTPCELLLADYASDGVLAIIRAEGSPAPDPVVAIWQGGDRHPVATEEDWHRLLDTLGNHGRVTVQRDGDMCCAIEPGGTYLHIVGSWNCLPRAAG